MGNLNDEMGFVGRSKEENREKYDFFISCQVRLGGGHDAYSQNK